METAISIRFEFYVHSIFRTLISHGVLNMSKGISGLKINALCVKNAMHKTTIVIDNWLYVVFIGISKVLYNFWKPLVLIHKIRTRYTRMKSCENVRLNGYIFE